MNKINVANNSIATCCGTYLPSYHSTEYNCTPEPKEESTLDILVEGLRQTLMDEFRTLETQAREEALNKVKELPEFKQIHELHTSYLRLKAENKNRGFFTSSNKKLTKKLHFDALLIFINKFPNKYVSKYTSFNTLLESFMYEEASKLITVCVPNASQIKALLLQTPSYEKLSFSHLLDLSRKTFMK